MCGRYYIDDKEFALSPYFDAAEKRAQHLGVSMVRSGEIYPTQIVPVIAPNQLNRAAEAYPMRWGFQHPSKGMLIFNVRSETVAQKDLFVTSVEDRRCAVPASRYFEWKKETDGKQKYGFWPKEGKLFLGGLYLRSSKEKIPSFIILTRDAVGEAAGIHKRMPLLIPENRIGDWLTAEYCYADIFPAFSSEVNFQKES